MDSDDPMELHVRIKLTSIMVDDQTRALAFYTQTLGFREKHQFPAGNYRWITVVSPDDPDGTELSLEPNVNPAGLAFQEAMFAQGIPVVAFEVDDIDAEHARLRGLGVTFTRVPTRMGPVSIAVLSDTCGNLVQLYQRIA